MTPDRARRLLDQIDVLRHPCDLDLLIFLARRPLTLLANENFQLLLGYEFMQIATSLDLLQRADLVTVAGNPTHVARKYVLAADGKRLEWLPDLLQLASTREGRLMLMRALKQRSASHAGRSPGTRAMRDAAPRPASNKRRRRRTK